LSVHLVRYFAGARAAAGVAEEKLVISTVADLVTERPELQRVLTACSFLVDGVAWHDRSATLPSDAIVDVLPPFAGG
jgi:molybdopterin synthase sulfur carrier subunit